jgi:hypothetical protein
MKDNLTTREIEKIKEIAKEYQSKGYKVILDPKPAELPNEIKRLNFQPDLIVMSDGGNLIVEVKTSKSIKDSRLLNIAEEIKAIDGWDFELIYTNPQYKPEFKYIVDSSSFIDAKNNLMRAESFLSTDASINFSDAGVMLVWAAIEGVLRVNYDSYKKSDRTIAPMALIRDSVMLGVISREQQHILESAVRMRNEAAHGRTDINMTNAELKRLVEIGYELLKDFA